MVCELGVVIVSVDTVWIDVHRYGAELRNGVQHGVARSLSYSMRLVQRQAATHREQHLGVDRVADPAGTNLRDALNAIGRSRRGAYPLKHGGIDSVHQAVPDLGRGVLQQDSNGDGDA